MDKQSRSRAETSLLKLLAVLIEDYEQKRYSMGDASPLDSLKELMRVRGIQAKDLWPVFGSKGITSEVLNGKRGISNEMARKLGEMFSVSPALFIAIHPAQGEIVKSRKRDLDAGVSSHLAPGYDVRTTSDSGVRVVRVIRERKPLTDWKAVKGVTRNDSVERIVASIIGWLSENVPEAPSKEPSQVH